MTRLSVAAILFIESVFFEAAAFHLEAQNAAAEPHFEVASVRPNTSGTTSMKFPLPSGGRFTVTNVNLKILVAFAYNVQGFGISGGPAWMGSDGYDVTARAEASNLDMNQYKSMLQALLRDRFKLAVHKEAKQAPVYALLPAKGGPKLPPSDPGGCVRSGPNLPPPRLSSPLARAPGEPAPVTCGTFFTGPSSLDARSMSMAQLANTLSIMVGRPALDKTELSGTFDIHLEFAPEGTALGNRPLNNQPEPDAAGNSDASGLPSIFTALQQTLGLRLESQTGTTDVLVIDHVERPDPN